MVRTSSPDKADTAAVRQIIVDAARRHGVPEHVALAFAWLESRFNPDAEGDTKWHEFDGGARYREHVLRSAKLKNNPARNTPEAWHSYGLFQLLAPHHVRANEHPRELLKPELNADRACAFIARLLNKTDGNVHQARLLYTGASKLSLGAQQRVLVQLEQALARFEGTPRGVA